MKRREILKAAVLFPFLLRPVPGKSADSGQRRKLIKAKRLKAGATFAVIAPASGVSQEDFDTGLRNLKELGFRAKVGKYARGRKGFLSGTDAERLADLHWAFADEEIDAVWCIRGGYGSTRILPSVEYDLIRKNPKILIGFSDITALHLAVFQKTGLVTFHGPNLASDLSVYTKRHLLDILMKPPAEYEIKLPQPPAGFDPELYKAKVITPGKARGALIGGNLSLLIALTGTPYAMKDIAGRILFIEDVNESPYRIDRMLTQLRQSLDLKTLAGIAVGVFTRNDTDPAEPSQTLMEVLHDRLGDLKIPVVYGLSFGHIREQFTIPLGIEAELDTAEATVTYLEKGVT